ncbi:MAG: hypothetical protein ACE5D0_10920 [Fidelibacterota bacterium]
MATCTHHKIKILILAIFGILFTGCVETLFSIKVFPDGRYSMFIRTQGDSTDVFNNDFPHPSGLAWTTKLEKEQNENEDIWIMETNGIAEGALLFTSRDDSLIALQHPIQVQQTKGYFATRYTLRNEFKGRKVYLKYPALGKSLQERDMDSTRWLDEAFYYMCSAGFNNLQNDPETAIDQILSERVLNHIHNTLAHINQKNLFEEMEDKQPFIDQMLLPFQQELPIGYSAILSKSTDIYEEELKLTTNLQDDQFQYWVFMPGVITTTNADTISGDTLKWSFGLNDYINDDYVIIAASIVYSNKRIQTAILFVSGIFLITLFLLYKRGR